MKYFGNECYEHISSATSDCFEQKKSILSNVKIYVVICLKGHI